MEILAQGSVSRSAAVSMVGRTSLALRIQCLCSLLPVRAVKAPQGNRRWIHRVDAAHVDGPPARVETRSREGVDAAVPAVVVLRGHCIELVQRQLALSGDAKAGVRRTMQI